MVMQLKDTIQGSPTCLKVMQAHEREEDTQGPMTLQTWGVAASSAHGRGMFGERSSNFS